MLASGRTVPIEDVHVGDRLAGRNPDLADDEHDRPTDVDPATWKLVRIECDRLLHDGTVDVVRIETLQSAEWLEYFDVAVGSMVPLPLDLEEMGLEPDLIGRVTAVEPCPRIAAGHGNVVLTTVNHDNQDVVELALESESGERETLRPTGLHAMYSADRQAWVSAKHLTPGETLNGLHGPVRVTSITSIPGRHRVYNFTIENEHVYYVSSLAALGHNSNYPGNVVENAAKGRAREARVQSKLAGKFKNASVQRERYLRTADGKRAIDPVTREARRIDHVVIENGQAKYLVETTGKDVNKSLQLAKEARIRADGGVYIRDKTTKQLIDVSGVPTRIIRIN